MNNANNDSLNYRVIGNGRPVVFLHGFLESMTMWEYLDFPDSIQQILIDLPGHGGSHFSKTSPFSMQSVAKEVKNTLNKLSLTDYDLVGHSMGGYIGLELLKIDDRCQKMVLLNSNFWEDSEQKKIDRLRVAKIVETNKKLFVYEAIPNLFLNPLANNTEITALIGEAVNIDSQAIASFSIAMSKRQNNTQLVQENAERISIIQGKEDPIISCEKMQELLRGTAVRINVLEDCGHMGHIEKSEEVRDIVVELLAFGH